LGSKPTGNIPSQLGIRSAVRRLADCSMAEPSTEALIR
jgi:hypothetical protein